MTLLKLGLELFRRYEQALTQRDAMVADDIRLAVYAIETILLHREACFKAGGHLASTKSDDVLRALTNLREMTMQPGFATTDASSTKLCLSILNNNLSTYIYETIHPKLPAMNESFEILRISQAILSRLTSPYQPLSENSFETLTAKRRSR